MPKWNAVAASYDDFGRHRKRLTNKSSSGLLIWLFLVFLRSEGDCTRMCAVLLPVVVLAHCLPESPNAFLAWPFIASAFRDFKHALFSLESGKE